MFLQVSDCDKQMRISQGLSIESRQIRTTSFTGIRHQLGVLVQRTLRDLRCRRSPRLFPTRDLLITDVHGNAVLHGIDMNHIAILYESDGSTNGGFGANVAWSRKKSQTRCTRRPRDAAYQ